MKRRLCCFFALLAVLSLLVIPSAAASGDVSVSISPDSVSIKTGQTRNLTAKVDPSDDNVKIVWTTSDRDVARVSSKGVVTGYGRGRAVITATAYDSEGAEAGSASVNVSVDDVSVSSVEISHTSITVRVNQTRILWAYATPLRAGEGDIHWSTSNRDVVIVDDEGTITGVGPGTATVTASAGNNRSASCTVTVPGTVLGESATDVKNKDITYAEVDGGELLSAAKLKLDVENAIKKADTFPATLVYRDKTTVTQAALRAAAYTAQYEKGAVQLRFQTLSKDKGHVEGQLTFDPAQVGEGEETLKLAVYTDVERIPAAVESAVNALPGKPAVIYLSQSGSFGMNVQVAAKVDLSGLDAGSLIFYSISGGKATPLPDQTHSIDGKGYLHFTTDRGGVIAVGN